MKPKEKETVMRAFAAGAGNGIEIADAWPGAQQILSQRVSRDGTRTDEPQRLQVKAVGESSVAETLEPARSKGGKLLQKSLPHFAEGFQTACIKAGQVPSR